MAEIIALAGSDHEVEREERWTCVEIKKLETSAHLVILID
jgi:hypothetical protein